MSAFVCFFHQHVNGSRLLLRRPLFYRTKVTCVNVVKIIGRGILSVDCKTVRIFAYSSTREQSKAENRERDWEGTLKIRTVRFAYVIFVRITRFSQPRAIPIG